MAPGIACEGPEGSLNTLFPTARWTFSPDPIPDPPPPQASAEVRIFVADETVSDEFEPLDHPAVSTVVVDDDSTAATVGVAMAPGDYVAYVRAFDTAGSVTPWCSSAFSLVGSLGTPTRPTGSVRGRLGCGDTIARVQTRGGGEVLADVPFSALNYGRKIDDVTDSNLTVAADGLVDERCCLALGGLTAWKHEVAIWRDDPDDPVWIGVVGEPRYGDAVTVPSRDLFQWFERRNLEHTRAFSNEDLGVIFQQYALDALERENSMGIVLEAYAAGTTGTRTVDGHAKPRAADQLRELARTGVDFTMVGRRLIFGGEELPVAALPTMTQEMISEPDLIVRGLDAATEFSVIGSTEQNVTIPHSGVAGGIDPDLGLVQTTVSENDIKDDRSCTRAAQTRLDLYSTGGEFLTAKLRPEAPIRFADLIPGARWPVAVRVKCRDVIGIMRLAEVAVDVSVADGGQTETVTVTLEPLGTTDLEAVSA